MTSGPGVDDDPSGWFLTRDERGNGATTIDDGRSEAWTGGNHVEVLVDGASYFPCLYDELTGTRAGDWVYLTDLQTDGDEQLCGEGTEIRTVLAAAARRGVNVRGLLWRSHPVGHGSGQVQNLLLARDVNEAGGELVLDHRVRRGGSHHQKIVVVQRESRASADDDVAYVGGIDLAGGRNDGPRHRGDPQPVTLGDARYGDRPPWHDVQLRVRGPAVADVALTFRERWLDPNPLDHPSPWDLARRYFGNSPGEQGSLAPPRRAHANGDHLVQVLRTYPARRPPYPFAPRGERSIARAYIKAFRRAQRLVYLEDQYLWSVDAVVELCAALRRAPELHCVIVIPRYPDPAGWLLGGASRFGRERLERALRAAGGDRVAIYDLENADGTPVYVHAKVCIVDDTWCTVGSDNLNRRSWTHDSEICCAVVDTAGELPRSVRVDLAREHLARSVSDDALADPAEWFAAFRSTASALDRWHEDGRRGARPPGALRSHPRDHVAPLLRPLLAKAHARLLDPDGRPRSLHQAGRY